MNVGFQIFNALQKPSDVLGVYDDLHVAPEQHENRTSSRRLSARELFTVDHCRSAVATGTDCSA
jgi:hypothetical protein